MKTPFIKTKKFILRPYKKEDKTDIIKNINNKKISRNLAVVPYPYKAKDAEDFLEKVFRNYKNKEIKQIHFAIEIENKFAGGASLSINKHMAEIGYWLGEDYWGKGIMTEVIKEIAKHGFGKLKLIRIFATVSPHNPASMAVLKKNGFEFEGIMKKYTKKGKKYLDRHLFAKVKK